MFYYLIHYSFDPSKPVFGPFNTEDEAWEAALNDAKKEYAIDEENGRCNELKVDKDSGEIALINYFVDRDDVTEYLIFEI